jgi:ribokinase
VLTIFNPAPATAVPAELWGLVDVVAPNETEAELLTGLDVADDAGAERAARELLARGAGAVVLTLGARGSRIVTADGSDWIAPLTVAAVDPTGAGDAYLGTLAVCVAAKLPLLDAARCANVVAALSVTAAGTQTSFPGRSAARDFLIAHGLDLPPALREARARA